MTEDTVSKNKITIDGEDYYYEDMTDEQRYYVDNVIDLNRKIGKADFTLKQMVRNRTAFESDLRKSLIVAKALAAAEADQPSQTTETNK